MNENNDPGFVMKPVTPPEGMIFKLKLPDAKMTESEILRRLMTMFCVDVSKYGTSGIKFKYRSDEMTVSDESLELEKALIPYMEGWKQDKLIKYYEENNL
jgi:hypothetical protein